MLINLSNQINDTMGQTRKLSVRLWRRQNSRMAVKIWQATYAAGRRNLQINVAMMKTTAKMQLELEICMQK